MSLDGAGRAALTSNTSSEFAPRVQKNGKLVFFNARGEDGLVHIWRMDRDGGNRIQITRGEGEFLASISPDGRSALFFQTTGSLYKVTTDGGTPVKLANQSLLDAQFSPDGTRIALSTYISEGELLRRHIAILFAQDGKPAMKPIPWPDGNGFRWSPAGDAIDYIKQANGVDNLWRQPLDGGAAKPLTHFTSLELFSFAWAPGGDKLFLSRGETHRDVVLITDFH
jgi:Tol biopolymer transport system component